MKDTQDGRWGWLGVACTVVAPLAVLLALLTIYLAGSTWMNLRSEKVEQRALEQWIIPVEPSSTRPHSREGRVVLDLAVGHFSVEPGEPGEPIRVEAAYDVNSYALEAGFEPSERAGWLYRVRFREIGWLRDGGLRGVFGGAYPEVRVYLPPDVPFALEGHFGKGVTDVELGGLWLTEIDLEVGKGAFEISIDEPLVAPVEVARIRGGQGSLRTRSLGNASPGELEVDFGMGRASVDLRGHWLSDANVRVRSTMGRAEVLVPGDVGVEGLGDRGPIVVHRDLELRPPTLTISASGFLGGLRITRSLSHR
jgi:hypothetical protein